MAERVEETTRTTVRETAPPVAAAEPVAVAPAAETVRRERALSTAQKVVYYIAGVIVVLLAFRFVLSLLGANRGNAFAAFIYAITYPLVAPFFGLFGYQMRYGVARFEIETLVAMVVYWLIAYAIVKLIGIARRDRSAV